MTPVEWMNENYYLPVESSYQEGKWETLPFQVAIINSMGNDEIPFPTGVGMNRVTCDKRFAWLAVPHRRGDEPLDPSRTDDVIDRSPQAWG